MLAGCDLTGTKLLKEHRQLRPQLLDLFDVFLCLSLFHTTSVASVSSMNRVMSALGVGKYCDIGIFVHTVGMFSHYADTQNCIGSQKSLQFNVKI